MFRDTHRCEPARPHDAEHVATEAVVAIVVDGGDSEPQRDAHDRLDDGLLGRRVAVAVWEEGQAFRQRLV
eukprot:16449510-Heterocapsa_arctica.AAC.1